jgi:hypothetical protein
MTFLVYRIGGTANFLFVRHLPTYSDHTGASDSPQHYSVFRNAISADLSSASSVRPN